MLLKVLYKEDVGIHGKVPGKKALVQFLLRVYSDSEKRVVVETP